MTEKVKVSKEVAKEVKYAKEEFRYELSALKYLFMEAEIENDEDVLLAIKAYLNGYEVEQTQEEKIKELFYGYAGENEFYESDAQKAIIKLLEIRGEEIKGVNT